MMDPMVIAAAPFYVCAVALAAGVSFVVLKAGVALFGNAQELQDEKSK